MENNKVLKFFYEISKIPRKSGEERQVANYIENFAKKRGLKFYRDKNENIIIIKEASEGYENEESIILQCHTDMICEKLEESKHDFFKDPIEVYIDGDFLRAKDTTLGADNGIGVAIILSILDSKECKHPKLETIFTVQEETTMLGAKTIDVKHIKGNKMICLDNMSEEELWIGCADALIYEYTLEILNRIKIKKDRTNLKIELNGFKGGHSGQDIGKNRGNPIKILSQIIYFLKTEKNIDINLNVLKGGSKVNVIPREVFCEIYAKNSDIDKLKKEIEKIEYKLKNSKIDNAENIKLDCSIEKSENQDCFDESSTIKILETINQIPNGVYCTDKFNNPQLSLNVGAIETDKKVKISFSIRSNLKEKLNELLKALDDIKKKYEITEASSGLPGYEHQEESDFINKCKEIYKETFNKKPRLINVHTCLEAGYFNLKIKDLDYVAIAPYIFNAHSPKECCSVSSTNRVYEYILKILSKDVNITLKK